MKYAKLHANPKLLTAVDSAALQGFYGSRHPAIISEVISTLSEEEIWALIQRADKHLRAEIFSHLDEDQQISIVGTLNSRDVASLMTDMPPDKRTDLFKELPEALQESVLPALAQAEREDIRSLSAHEEGTAGAVMTSAYATLSPELTTAQAIERLREVAPDSEMIYYAYVLGEQRQLLGFVSLKKLILAQRSARVDEIMHTGVIFARVEDDQEEVARKIQKYDLLALPVINAQNALVGIVTHDDAMDIMTQEHTEDMEKFMGIGGAHEDAAYIKTGVWGHFRNRYPWVVALAMLGLVSGFIVQRFEGLLLQFAILAMFMPMLADTGGNTGSQSATLVVRALALKEITSKDVLRILGKELQVALLLAVLLGAIAFGRVFFFGGGSSMPEGFSLLRIASAISLALGLQVVTSTLIGALLPLGAAKMKLDPAVVASPALTTIVDITGLMIYFTIAKLMIGGL
ncbi:MAG: magnesium transporter [Desulfuromonadaceae bacterium]|nr:magnesium transporter [Desulfuromonadaceae bacterium]